MLKIQKVTEVLGSRYFWTTLYIGQDNGYLALSEILSATMIYLSMKMPLECFYCLNIEYPAKSEVLPMTMLYLS